METNSYESILCLAEGGNPHAMLQIAKIIKAGAFSDNQFFDYVYWLKQFFDHPYVKYLLLDLEESDADPNENSSDRYEEPPGFDYLIDRNILMDDIVDAGLMLGILFSMSSSVDELKLSQSCLYSALLASRWDSIETTDNTGADNDVLSILTDVTLRISELEGD